MDWSLWEDKSETIRTVMDVEGNRGKRRPKKWWSNAVKNDIRTAGKCKDDARVSRGC